MSILIKNMAMPKNCGECPLFESKYHYHGCHAKPESFSLMNMWDFVGERPEWCPLTEILPHGDLIDRDAVAHEIWLKHCEECSWERLHSPICSLCPVEDDLDIIEQFPKVIEEEGEE